MLLGQYWILFLGWPGFSFSSTAQFTQDWTENSAEILQLYRTLYSGQREKVNFDTASYFLFTAKCYYMGGTEMGNQKRHTFKHPAPICYLCPAKKY